MKTGAIRSRVQKRELPYAAQAIGVALLVLCAYVLGVLGLAELPLLINLAALAPLGAGAVWLNRKRRQLPGLAGQKTTLPEALLLLGAAFLFTRWLFGAGIELYGLIFLLVAWVVVTASPKTAAITVGLAALVEALSHGFSTATATTMGFALVSGLEALNWALLAPRLGMLLAFSALAWVLVGQHASTRRKAYDRDVERERLRLLEEAREFRLIHAGRSESGLDRQAAEELIVRDAVEAVHHTVFMTLELMKTALKAHTVILLWFDLRNERLKIRELVSDCDDLVEGSIDPAGGVIGGIARRRDAVSLSGLRPGFRGLAYYRQPPGVTEFLGVPIIEHGHLRGVLCVDRNASRGFDEEESRLVEESAAYVLRAIENERMVASIERTRFEVGRFFEASRRLNGVLTPREVYEVALQSVREISAYDFAAITFYDEESDSHRVMSVDGEGATTRGKWNEVAFQSNNGLVSMVVRNRHYLPVGGRLRERRAVVLSESENFSELQSLLVLPLIVHDQAMGTMIIGHRQPEQFASERREMLEVVANQVAVTLQNARLYAQMENMAKYDALTGLANRRSFQEKLSETMARHKRAGRTFGLVLTDIDHFKSVNDTYGHPVGDEVLRQVGRTLQEKMREVDTPCRYGGEEFVLILEDTDLEGARHVANRLREAIAALQFETDQGPLRCTISMGIALGPWDSDEPHTLVDLADQALYYSKKNGRNQVSVYREVITSGQAA